jgi:HTH-type transcriptional regulator, transcriptional repressor of NAD biosynthesis genes
MYNVGVFPGKFFPPHRGHLNSIIQAATQVNKLYVVVSDNMTLAAELCRKESLKDIPLELRAKWLSIELQNIDHIKVTILDEAGIPPYPEGCKPWANRLQEVVPEKFDVIFGGELEYRDTYMRSMPEVVYETYDYKRTRYPISATEIRQDYLKNWNYILGSAREFFARRVLVTGTESCGKTTLVKYLAKIFHTSWSEELGRYYPKDHLGNNDKLLSAEDFFRIAFLQQMQDEEALALRSANRIVFFDSDAVVTQYYCKMYLGEYNDNIEKFVDPSKYDVTLILTPDVKWVPDGLRWKSRSVERARLHEELTQMYFDRGFKNVILLGGDTYKERLNVSINIADKLVADRNYCSRWKI